MAKNWKVKNCEMLKAKNWEMLLSKNWEMLSPANHWDAAGDTLGKVHREACGDADGESLGKVDGKEPTAKL